MEKLKNKEWWVFNLIMASGMSLVMTISVPLIIGAPLILRDLLVYGIIGFLSGMIVNIVLPMKRIAESVNDLFTTKKSPSLQSLVITIIMTIAISGIIQIFQGLIRFQDWLNLLKLLPILTIIAYLFSFLFIKIIDQIIKRM